MTQYQYVIVLTPQEEGGYTATVPALQGCISEGDTKEEALANIRDAIEGYLFVAQKHNLPLFSGVEGHPFPVPVPMHNRDLKRGTLYGIIHRAGLTPEEFLKIK